MISSEKIAIKNWAIGKTPEILQKIHLSDVNISIYERDIHPLESEIKDLLERKNIELRARGTVDIIQDAVSQALDPRVHNAMLTDIIHLLQQFKEISKAENFRLLLATVNDNMCKKFHTDINDLRMLCTYSGPGTLWLTEENINQKSLDARKDNVSIVIDKSKIQQAKTGAAVILKGALYPHEDTRAAVHRSPSIEESGIKRLLLRIDTDEFLNF